MFGILFDLVNLICIYAITLYNLIFSEIQKDLTNKIGKIYD